MKAYYFAPNNNKLRYSDDREIIIGKMHTIKGIPKLCEKGLHGSIRALDALKYAPGSMLYIVDITRNLDIGYDKICGQRREYITGFNAEKLLEWFARKQALINIEKIKPYVDKYDYDIIVKYLNTGDESLKSDAKSAAESAFWSASESVAWSSAESAARSAARSATRSAARSAAWYASKSASESVAWSAAESAFWSAAESAAESAANDMLEQMINEELKKNA